jgi:proteasome lid subunit RPN8/RPN11
MQIECTLEEFHSLFPALKKPQRRRSNTSPAPYERQPPMKWTQSVYQQIIREIGSKPPELGGILLGPTGESLATHFAFDEAGRGSTVSWTFGHDRINELLRQYVPLKLDMKGFVHSHPSGVTSLSTQDVTDFRKPFANGKNQDLTEVWAPIVVGGRVIPYMLLRDQPQPVLAQLVLT